MIDPLTFDHLDDLCLALGAGDDPPLVEADGLGPLLELSQVLRLKDGGRVPQWLSVGRYAALLNELPQADAWYCPSGARGIIQVSHLQSNDLAWGDAVNRLKRAAINAGFANDHGGKFAAAIGEMYNNVIEHSQAVGTGYVAFDATPGRFEFVIADSGIGVLESLRSNPEYAHIGDSGTALERALNEGVSRHAEPGRGQGFRPLFIGLANISALIRFRSADYGRIIERSGESISSQTVQLAPLVGFLSSVTCYA